MNGRKRHIVVDVLGLIVGLLVHEANIQDRAGGIDVVDTFSEQRPKLRHMWGDSAYTGSFVNELRRRGWTVEIVKRSDAEPPPGRWQDPQIPWPIVIRRRFVLIKRRWVVERTFAWLGRYRRLSRDYEQLVEVSCQMVWAAACRMMCQRLAHDY